jgi:hypothetical protein
MSAPPNSLSEHDLELLSAYLDGELPDRDRQTLEQRLAHEDLLRMTLDDLRDTIQLVQSLPRVRAPRNFTLDPALYGRKTPWWRGWLRVEQTLQWAGAVGTMASILLIVVGLLAGGANETRQQAANEDTAFEAASLPTTQPAGASAPDETAIAYSGDGVFQATLEMQSAYYGGTGTAEAMLAVPDMALSAPVASSQMKDEGDNTPEPAAAFAAEPSQAESGLADGAVSDAVPSPTGVGAGQSLNVFNTVESSEAAGIVESAGPMMAQGAPPAEGMIAEDQPPGAFAAGADGLEESPGAMQPVPAPPVMSESAGPADAAREYEDDEAASNTQPLPSAVPPLAAVDTITTPAAGEEVAQIAVEQTEAPAQYRRESERAEQERQTWWLAGIGLITLLISMGVFLLGRKRARHA